MGIKKLIKANTENNWEYILYYVIKYFINDIYKFFNLKKISYKIFGDYYVLKNIIYWAFYFMLFFFLFSFITSQIMMVYHSRFDTSPYTFSETMNSNYIMESQHIFFNIPEEIKSSALINYKPLDLTNDNLKSLDEVYTTEDENFLLGSEESRYRLKNLSNFISEEKKNYQNMKDTAINKNRIIIRRCVNTFIRYIPFILLESGWMFCWCISVTYYFTLNFHDFQNIENFILFHYIYNILFLFFVLVLFYKDPSILFFILTIIVIYFNYKRLNTVIDKYEKIKLPI